MLNTKIFRIIDVNVLIRVIVYGVKCNLRYNLGVREIDTLESFLK